MLGAGMLEVLASAQGIPGIDDFAVNLKLFLCDGNGDVGIDVGFHAFFMRERWQGANYLEGSHRPK